MARVNSPVSFALEPPSAESQAPSIVAQMHKRPEGHRPERVRDGARANGQVYKYHPPWVVASTQACAT